MRRFEFKDGKSDKFWEITVEGDSFTVRFGRVGTDGQTSTKTYADAAKGEAEANKLIAAKTKKGYVEVEAGDEAGQAAPASVSGNAELEAAIFAAPQDLDAWGVYGDWLQERGDPRGELLSLEVEAERGNVSAASAQRCEAIFAQHRAAWLGETLTKALEMQVDGEEVLELQWKFGFIHFVKVRAVYDFSGPKPNEIWRALFKLESFKFAQEVRIGVTGLEGDADFDDVLMSLSKHGKLRSIRRIFVGDFESEEQEITWVKVGNVGRLWPVLPNLEYMLVRGGGIELGVVEHDKLAELHIETAGLPKAAVRSLAKAKLPALHTLEVWLGEEERSEQHGEHSDIDDLRPLLTGAGLPKLRHLGLKNCDYEDDIAIALCTAPIVKQLETLDLSMGVMAGDGASALIEHVAHFKHLGRIDLSQNAIDDALQTQLHAEFGERIELADQRDEEDRYISVSE